MRKQDTGLKLCPSCNVLQDATKTKCPNCGYDLTEVMEESMKSSQKYEAVLGEKNKIYYQTKFEEFDKRGPGLKASWNWPAFFAGGCWALYRKMYGWFFALWGAYLIGLLFEKTNLPGLSILFYLVPWVAFAVFANSLYQRNLQKKIAVARTTIQDEQKVIAYLHYKGGVNTWVVWVFVAFLSICAIGILAAILIPMFAGK